MKSVGAAMTLKQFCVVLASTKQTNTMPPSFWRITCVNRIWGYFTFHWAWP